ncbi:MAG: ketopantoate reductase family protein, partial [Chloroflexota bacterium]
DDPFAYDPGRRDDFEERADAALMAMAAPMRGGVKQHMGIWRDLKVKRRKTEVDVQIAALVDYGERNGIPTPVNRAVLDVIHEIERGERGMDWENLQAIATNAGVDSGDYGALPA